MASSTLDELERRSILRSRRRLAVLQIEPEVKFVLKLGPAAVRLIKAATDTPCAPLSWVAPVAVSKEAD